MSRSTSPQSLRARRASGARRGGRAGYGRGLRNPETTFPALIRGIIGLLYLGFGLFLVVKPSVFELPDWQVMIGGGMLALFGTYRLWIAYQVAYSPIQTDFEDDEVFPDGGADQTDLPNENQHKSHA